MVEVQIRTKEMHERAETGIAAHWRYKEGKVKFDEIDAYMAWLRKMVDWQSGTPEPQEFMHELKMDLFQDDPWLLGSTLPHELTHLLLADTHRDAKLPLALDEGLALQAEPPARRLQFRRLLRAHGPRPTDLLTTTNIPADQLTFYARCDALTSLLLHQAGLTLAVGADRSPIAVVLRTFRDGYTPDWWKTLGWDTEPALRRDWAAWYEARRRPPRMPLMILAQPGGNRG